MKVLFTVVIFICLVSSGDTFTVDTEMLYMDIKSNEKCYPIKSSSLLVYSLPGNDQDEVKFRYGIALKPLAKPIPQYNYTEYRQCYSPDRKHIKWCEIPLPEIFDAICITSKTKYNIQKKALK
jgi:hypothetical protein